MIRVPRAMRRVADAPRPAMSHVPQMRRVATVRSWERAFETHSPAVAAPEHRTASDSRQIGQSLGVSGLCVASTACSKIDACHDKQRT